MCFNLEANNFFKSDMFWQYFGRVAITNCRLLFPQKISTPSGQRPHWSLKTKPEMKGSCTPTVLLPKHLITFRASETKKQPPCILSSTQLYTQRVNVRHDSNHAPCHLPTMYLIRISDSEENGLRKENNRAPCKSPAKALYTLPKFFCYFGLLGAVNEYPSRYEYKALGFRNTTRI